MKTRGFLRRTTSLKCRYNLSSTFAFVTEKNGGSENEKKKKRKKERQKKRRKFMVNLEPFDAK
jgi:hypothetical protein